MKATKQELEAYYNTNIKVIGESFEDFEAEHQNMSIEQIKQKYTALIELGRKLNHP